MGRDDTSRQRSLGRDLSGLDELLHGMRRRSTDTGQRTDPARPGRPRVNNTQLRFRGSVMAQRAALLRGNVAVPVTVGNVPATPFNQASAIPAGISLAPQVDIVAATMVAGTESLYIRAADIDAPQKTHAARRQSTRKAAVLCRPCSAVRADPCQGLLVGRSGDLTLKIAVLFPTGDTPNFDAPLAPSPRECNVFAGECVPYTITRRVIAHRTRSYRRDSIVGTRTRHQRTAHLNAATRFSGNRGRINHRLPRRLQTTLVRTVRTDLSIVGGRESVSAQLACTATRLFTALRTTVPVVLARHRKRLIARSTAAVAYHLSVAPKCSKISFPPQV